MRGQNMVPPVCDNPNLYARMGFQLKNRGPEVSKFAVAAGRLDQIAKTILPPEIGCKLLQFIWTLPLEWLRATIFRPRNLKRGGAPVTREGGRSSLILLLCPIREKVDFESHCSPWRKVAQFHKNEWLGVLISLRTIEFKARFFSWARFVCSVSRELV